MVGDAALLKVEQLSTRPTDQFSMDPQFTLSSQALHITVSTLVAIAVHDLLCTKTSINPYVTCMVNFAALSFY
jgi:hypothetical protein